MARRATPLLALICAASLAAGAETGGAETGGAETGGVESGGAEAGRNGRLAGLPLTEALEIVRTLGLRLVYSSEVVRPWMRVEREPEPGEPGAVLDDLLAPHGLEAREGPGGLLVIVRGPGDGKAPGAIEGVVRSGAGRRPVVAARVMVAGTPFEAATDPDGGFHIPRLPADKYDLIVTVPGLREERFEGVAVRPGQTTRVRLVLAAVATIREAIVVTPDRRPSSAERSDAGRPLDGDDLRAVPGVGDDLHRALARQPGLTAADRSASFSIRGGEPDEVLVLFDGQELYDPFHLKDFQRASGIIDTLTVGDARLFALGFPAEYGDRMSGVVDLSSTVPAAPGSILLSTGFINSRILTSGRLRGGAGHWLISARAWHPDAVVRTIDRENEGFAPTYHDLLGKAQFLLGASSVLTAHFLAARDDVDFTDPDADESVAAGSGTRYAWVTLDTVWSARLQSRTLFSYGRIHNGRSGRLAEEGAFLASVEDHRNLNVFGLGQDWSLRASERLLLKWGAAARWLDSTYGYVSFSEEGPSATRALDLFAHGTQAGAYLAAQFRPWDALTLETGLRWDHQSHTGETQASPRVSLTHALGRAGRIRAAWGRYSQSQGVHELPIEDGVTSFFPAQTSAHWTFGFERELGGGLAFRADAYRKDVFRPRPRFENLFNPYELLPEFEPDRVRIDPERAAARGVELTLARDAGGPVDWSATYSRSTAVDILDGRRVPRSRDQPHAFQFALGYRSTAWEAGLAGVWHTGWPTTAMGGRLVEEPGGETAFEPVPGPRNGDRLPDYHRLDVRVGRHLRLGRGRLTIYAEVTNLYDRRNVCCVEDFAFVPGADGSVLVDREEGYWLQRVPSLGIVWRFDP
jgi:hypothetical protein